MFHQFLVVLVLKKIIEEKIKGNFCMLALGPGFTVAMSELRIKIMIEKF